MKLYIFSMDYSTQKLSYDSFEVEECEKTFVLSSNRHQRFPKNKINKFDPESCTILTFNPDPKHAAEIFIRALESQISAYSEIIQKLSNCKKGLEAHGLS